MSTDPRHHEPNAPSPGGEELDALLREWHRQNAERAAAGRESLMARLRAEAEKPAGAMKLELPPLIDDEMEQSLRARTKPDDRAGPVVTVVRRFTMHRMWSAAAAALILAATLPLIMINRGGGPGVPGLVPPSGSSASIQPASFEGYVMCPEGGRLEAKDPEGNLLGPCELKHTDVVVDVSGFLTRVTLTQKYHNPHTDKIEALYTFPLSERGAVDRMTMMIGSRVIEGQVKEKGEARRIYEQAKAEGRVASLLEQQRPNIFSQSIANIEPGATIDITISYVETTKQVGGVFEFDFPTTITPRFTPGSPITGDTPPPAPRPNLMRRHGLVLLAPATISELRAGDLTSRSPLTEAQLSEMLRRAAPIRAASSNANIWYTFRAAYQDGSAEFGTLYTDGLGTVNGRWFCIPDGAMPGAADVLAEGAATTPGAAFAPDTDRVPDASKVTPMPAKPGTRAGHDISITVNIDTGGPVLGAVSSPLHEIVTTKAGSRATVKLKGDADIPNRDFVLKWRQESRDVEPAVFTSSGDRGNFFAVQLVPPPAMNDDEIAAIAVPREMVFVLDVSGSMSGRPIEKAKEVLDKALSTLRPNDTFNVIRFQNSLVTLWGGARRATPENLVEARAFYNQEIGGGGTQMLAAIQAAYGAGGPDAPQRFTGLTPLDLANLPADRRDVTVDVPFDQFRRVQFDAAIERRNPPVETWMIRANQTVEIEALPLIKIPSTEGAAPDAFYRLHGVWETAGGRRVFAVRSASIESRTQRDPYRVIVFLTDGAISNENEVIAEIQAKHGRAAIFSFAIGNSPNRYLLDSMARFGRGEVEYVYESTNADEVIARFAQRIQTPVLTNIKVEFSPNLNVLDVMTALGGGGGSVSNINTIPDLFDVKPLTIVGRYNQPATGTVTISGMTAAGPYRRVVNLDLPAPLAPEQRQALDAIRSGNVSDTISTLWARAKVEAVTGEDLRGVLAGNMRPDLRSQIVTLGETFNLVTQYTSFVAVDRLRITVAGKPRLVHIPIELPAGTQYEGFFGRPATPARELDDDMALLNFGSQLTPYSYGVETAPTGEQLFAFTLNVPLAVGDGTLDVASPYTSEKPDYHLFDALTAANPADPASPGEPAQEKQRSFRVSADPAARAQDSSQAKRTESGAVAGKPASEEARSFKRTERPATAARGDAPRPRDDDGSGRGGSAAPGRAPAQAGQGVKELAQDSKKKDAEDKTGAGAPSSAGQPAPPAEAKAPGGATPPPAPAPTSAPAQAPAAAPPSPVQITAGGEVVREAERKAEAAHERMRENLSDLQLTMMPAGASAVLRYTDSDSAFFGFVKRIDESSPAGAWQIAGVEQERTADAAALLGNYFDIIYSPAATLEQNKLSGGVEAAEGASKSMTSHPRSDPEANAGKPAPRHRVVLAEHIIIRIGVLVHENKLEQAASLAAGLANAIPGVAEAAEVSRVLTDASVAPEERVRVIDEQSESAKKRLEAIRREAKLRQRLDASLVEIAIADGYPRTLSELSDKPAPGGVTMIDGGILLSILVTDAGDKMKESLAAAGLRIETADQQTKVIVGVAPLGRLADVALVEGVRKVEATR